MTINEFKNAFINDMSTNLFFVIDSADNTADIVTKTVSAAAIRKKQSIVTGEMLIKQFNAFYKEKPSSYLATKKLTEKYLNTEILIIKSGFEDCFGNDFMQDNSIKFFKILSDRYIPIVFVCENLEKNCPKIYKKLITVENGKATKKYIIDG